MEFNSLATLSCRASYAQSLRATSLKKILSCASYTHTRVRRSTSCLTFPSLLVGPRLAYIEWPSSSLIRWSKRGTRRIQTALSTPRTIPGINTLRPTRLAAWPTQSSCPKSAVIRYPVITTIQALASKRAVREAITFKRLPTPLLGPTVLVTIKTSSTQEVTSSEPSPLQLAGGTPGL